VPMLPIQPLAKSVGITPREEERRGFGRLKKGKNANKNSRRPAERDARLGVAASRGETVHREGKKHQKALKSSVLKRQKKKKTSCAYGGERDSPVSGASEPERQGPREKQTKTTFLRNPTQRV